MKILAQFLSAKPGDVTQVESVQQGFTLDLRNTGNPGNLVKFIHHHGVHDKGWNIQLFGDGICHKGAQIGGVDAAPAAGVLEVFQHLRSDLPSAATDGTDQAATTDHGMQSGRRDLVFPHGLHHQLPAKIILVYNRGIGGQLFRFVPQHLFKNRTVSVIHGNLGGGGTGVDGEYAIGHKFSCGSILCFLA